jgi:pre-rRNA-processing protein TSR3
MLPPCTIIVRHPRERPQRCSVYPLKGRPGILFLDYPVAQRPDLTQYIRLAAEGPPLSEADADRGILLLDASWRRADSMVQAFLDVEPRSLSGWKTAYPRVSKLGTDPENGLASIEALYLAYHILRRDPTGLLDHYLWAEAFLQENGITPNAKGQALVEGKGEL